MSKKYRNQVQADNRGFRLFDERSHLMTNTDYRIDYASCIIFFSWVVDFDGYMCFMIYNRRDLLTHCGLMATYGDINLGQYWLGNGLLPDSTMPLPQMLTYHRAFICGRFQKWQFTPNLKTAYLNSRI